MDQSVKGNFEKAGFDVVGSIRRFAGNEALYAKHIFKFIDDKIYENLIKAMNEGNMENAFHEAHALKGVSGNLGLNPLFNPVSELVKMLRKNNSQADLDELFAAVEAGYKIVIDVLTANKINLD
ncbi:MAG: Hpt domain-containing protein [Leptospirales bacterium]|nr:Hpt domain-containing protein [Leptospirales bacterium]